MHRQATGLIAPQLSALLLERAALDEGENHATEDIAIMCAYRGNRAEVTRQRRETKP